MKKTKRILAWFLAVALLAANCLVWGTQTQAAPKVKKLTLNRSSYSMFVGESVTLRVSSVQPSKASKKVTWQSSNRKIATVTVTASGVKVKAKKSGKVTITAKSRSNPKVKAACTITIHKNTKSIKLNGKSAYTLKAGTTKQLSVTTSPEKQPVIWSSKNTKIAKVNSKGKVTAVAKGKTTITAKSGKKTVKVTITVTEDKNIVDSGKIQGLEWKLYRNGKMTISGTYKPEGYDYPLSVMRLISESWNKTLRPFSEKKYKEYQKMIRSIVMTAKGLPSMEYYFANLENLETVDLRRCDTSKVTSMRSMFLGCKKLKSVNLKGINTKKVKDMGGMFLDCEKLETLDLSGLDTRNVTDMGSMFSNCKKLKSINLKGISTRSVTDMGGMFCDCKSLQSLDLSGFDTRKAVDMGGMFVGCESLQSLDLSGFDTRKAVSMGCMFEGCTKLKKLNISSFDTRNVKSIIRIFYGCRSLKTLDLPLKFTGYDGERKNGIDSRDYVFDYCDSLEELDAGGLVWCGDYYHPTMGNGIFSTCKKLKKLDLSHTVVIKGGSLNCANLESVMIPVNLTADVKLPAVFQDASGNTYDYIPRNMPKTFEIRRVR